MGFQQEYLSHAQLLSLRVGSECHCVCVPVTLKGFPTLYSPTFFGFLFVSAPKCRDPVLGSYVRTEYVRSPKFTYKLSFDNKFQLYIRSATCAALLTLNGVISELPGSQRSSRQRNSLCSVNQLRRGR